MNQLKMPYKKINFETNQEIIKLKAAGLKKNKALHLKSRLAASSIESIYNPKAREVVKSHLRSYIRKLHRQISSN